MKYFWVFSYVIVMLACGKEEIQSVDCDKLYEAALSLDENVLKIEIEKLTANLHPSPTAEDFIGHSANLQTLVDRLNENCENYTASIECYTCIYTFPAQSEVSIDFNDGHTILIYLHTPEKDILRFAGAAQP
jgi:hypothetical protein